MEKLSVFLGALGGAEISFLPKTTLTFPQPWTFRIEHKPHVAAPSWLEVDTISDTYYLTDDRRYNWNMVAESWYRVVLLDADGFEWPSRPVQIGNNWGRRDFIAAREICRKFYLACRIGTGGKDVYLCRKKDSGDLCPVCGDEVTGQPTNSQCAACYGTGVAGGYYDAYPMTMWVSAKALQYKQDEPHGRDLMEAFPVQTVNFPWIYPHDVIVDKDSGFRYAIQDKIQVVDEVRNVPLIVSVELQKLGTTDVVYGIPTPSVE